MSFIAPPVLDIPITSSDGYATEYFRDLVYDLWLRTGGERGAVIFNLLADATYTTLFEDQQGNTWLVNNARYNVGEGYWERIDETRASWLFLLLGVSEPGEEAIGLPAQTAGTWVAQPSKVGGVNNPAFTPETPTRRIKTTFGVSGGWEATFRVTQFGDGVIKGYGIEFDANGNVPFARVVHGFTPDGTYRWTGFLYNVYLDHSGSDRAKKPNAAVVLRTLDSDQSIYDWTILFADPTDPSAGDDEVGTDAPTFDEAALSVRRVTGSVNYLSLLPALTGDPILLEATGSDSNIDIRLAPKGEGRAVVKITGTDAYLDLEDGTTTAGHVGVGAQGNTLILKAGNIFAATFNNLGAVSLAQAATAASVAGDFTADEYFPITLNGATRYIPVRASTW
jgi:hypothetical protein